VSDDSYTLFRVIKVIDLKGDFLVIHTDSTLNNYINNLYLRLKIKIYRMVKA